jgi:hypothetical protein
MSSTNVSSVIDFDNRCERSPSPVWVGVTTVWPRLRSVAATLPQHHPPCHAPCTSTKVLPPAAFAMRGAAVAAAAMAAVVRNDRRSISVSPV